MSRWCLSDHFQVSHFQLCILSDSIQNFGLALTLHIPSPIPPCGHDWPCPCHAPCLLRQEQEETHWGFIELGGRETWSRFQPGWWCPRSWRIPELIINPARGLAATAHMSVTAKAEITCDQQGSRESRGDQLGTSQNQGTLSASKSCGLPWF